VLFEEEITAAIGHYHAKDYRRVFAPASSTPSTAEIEINNLSHVYAKGSPFENVALRGVSMQVPEHAIHGLAGATGSGKSTLLQHMNGLLLPQAGQVRIGPFCMHEPNADIRGARKRAGLVFQVPENQMFEPYVGDEIAYGPRRLGLDGEALRERVRVAMTQVGLGFEEFKDRQTFTLSGGERRKVALASVLALEPAILLLDEPTAGLDPRSRAELLRMLKSLQADGKTLVISSHRMADLAELCNQLTILENGQVAADGTSEGIFQQMDTLEAAGLQPPIAVRIANILRVKGWPIQPDVLRLPQLVEALTALKESNESV
jgi:energy-coupling factor transport system ATP-binding protein